MADQLTEYSVLPTSLVSSGVLASTSLASTEGMCVDSSDCSTDTYCPYDGVCTTDVPQPTKVECEKTIKLYDSTGSNLISTSYQYESGLTPGLTYTPSAHMPSYDSSTYELYSITFNGTNVTTGSITCPSYDFSLIYTFRALQPSVTPWSWYASNGDASYSQTVGARDAVVNKTSVQNFSYLVWNDLVNKTLEAIHARGDYWHTNFAAYESTLMTASDKRLTATRFNSLRYNIGYYASTGISDKASGDTVLGDYFTTLATKLNEFIATL